MTMIAQPHWAYFSQTGGDGLGSAFVAAAHGVAGFGGTPALDPSEGPPFALITAAAWDGLDGDRPAWVVLDDGSAGLLISAGWDTGLNLFNPYSYSFAVDAEVEVFLNGVTGAWWVAENGVLRGLGSRVRRFPTDMAEGIVSRYMVLSVQSSGGIEGLTWRHDGAPYDPEQHSSAETRGAGEPIFFSPLGPVGGAFGIAPFPARAADTMLPTVAPIFPMFLGSGDPVPPVYMGDLLDLMVATDGFDLEAPPIPGWRLLKSAPDNDAVFYAVPFRAD